MFLPMLQLVGVLLLLEILVSLAFRYALHGQEQQFGVAAVTIVTCVDVLSFVTGFSIGWAWSIVNVIAGLFLAELSKLYRPYILVATLVSLLLALSLRGHFSPASMMLKALLPVVVISAVVAFVRNRPRQGEQASHFVGLTVVTCLGAGLLWLMLVAG